MTEDDDLFYQIGTFQIRWSDGSAERFVGMPRAEYEAYRARHDPRYWKPLVVRLGGQDLSVSQFCRLIGRDRGFVDRRLSLGWLPKEIAEAPAPPTGHHPPIEDRRKAAAMPRWARPNRNSDEVYLEYLEKIRVARQAADLQSATSHESELAQVTPSVAFGML